MKTLSFLLFMLVSILTVPLWGTWFLVRALLGIQEQNPTPEL